MEVLTTSQSSLDDQDDDEQGSVGICIQWTEEGKITEPTSSTKVMCSTNIAVWFLSVLASHDEKSKLVIMEAGGIDVLTEKISRTQVVLLLSFKWDIFFLPVTLVFCCLNLILILLLFCVMIFL